MRIAYGIHGYGRGHATRSHALMQFLRPKHNISIFAGDDAYSLLKKSEFPTTRIPSLGYEVSKHKAGFSAGGTIQKNMLSMVDLFLRGPAYKVIKEQIIASDPDIIISDSEPWTQHIANELNIPLLSLDHFAVLAYSDWDMPYSYKIRKTSASLLYKSYMGDAQRIVGTAFFRSKPSEERVKLLGPILRKAVRHTQPTRGDHMLVYLSKPEVQYTPQLIKALQSYKDEVIIYGLGKLHSKGNLHFKGFDPHGFVKDLASCNSVVSSAGNQLTSEALYFKKPLIAMPQESIEQHLNAHAIEQMGIGMSRSPTTITKETFRELERNDRFYMKQLKRNSRDHTERAVEEIERFIRKFR